MVKLILATDMGKHKELLDELQTYVPTFDFANKTHLDAVNFEALYIFLYHFFNFISFLYQTAQNDTH